MPDVVCASDECSQVMIDVAYHSHTGIYMTKYTQANYTQAIQVWMTTVIMLGWFGMFVPSSNWFE